MSYEKDKSFSLPKDWEIKKLGEVCAKITDGTHQTPKYFDRGFVFLSSKNVTSGKIDWENVKYIDEKQHLEMHKRVAPRIGDILLAKNGTTGVAAMVDREIVFDIYVSLAWIRSNGKIVPEYLLHFINSPEAKIQFNKKLKGIGVPNLHLEEIREVEIAFPKSIPEQHRIVSILDRSFAAIDKAKANTEQNLKNAKELFESYLEEVFEKGNWEKKTIENVCDEIFAGGDAPKNNFSLEPNEKYKIPIYANSVKDMGLYGFTDFARVTKPCITIAARGSGTGHTELREDCFLPIVRLIVCLPNTDLISKEFLKYAIDKLIIQRSGSAIPQLTVPMLKDYQIPVPSIEDQKNIIDRAETLAAETQKLEDIYKKKIVDLEELKKSVLQKAFAGKL